MPGDSALRWPCGTQAHPGEYQHCQQHDTQGKGINGCMHVYLANVTGIAFGCNEFNESKDIFSCNDYVT